MSSEAEKPPESRSRLEETLTNISTSIGRMVDIVRAKPRAGNYFEAITDHLNYTDTKRANEANWEFRNEQNIPIALRSLIVIFDDLPSSDTYVPNFVITAGKAPILKAHDKSINPYRNADLNLDLKNGIILEPQEKVELWIWNDGSDQTAKRVSLFVDFGEA